MVAAAGILVLRMFIAAISGMGAATVCHPLDVIRVQLQTEGNSFTGPVDCAKGIIKTGKGPMALYAGIGAAYLRQWLYGSCRIGIYAFLLEQAQKDNLAKGLSKNAIPFASKLVMGCISGGIGSAVGTPSELALVRMSNDSKLPIEKRQNYKGVVDCIRRIAKEDGIGGLWNGATVTVLRAMVLSSAVLAITSECKVRLTATGLFGPDGNLFQGFPLLVVSIFVSSFFANIVSNPFDVVKSRTQQQSKTGVQKYSSMMDCFIKIIAEEGVFKLWAGFVPAFLKLAPYTIISLLLTEKISLAVTGDAAL